MLIVVSVVFHSSLDRNRLGFINVSKIKSCISPLTSLTDNLCCLSSGSQKGPPRLFSVMNQLVFLPQFIRRTVFILPDFIRDNKW